MKKTKAVLLGVILWSLLLISGCNFIRIEEEPRKPLEYSIVKNEEIPAELAALIQEKKKNEFQLTYQCEKDLFLVKGYGEQMSGRLQYFRGRTGVDFPGCFFPDNAAGAIRRENNDQSAFLSLHRGEDGIPKRTCDF